MKKYDPIAISLVITWLTFVESDWFSAILFWRVILRYSYFRKTQLEGCFWNLLSLNSKNTPSTVPSDRHLGFEQSVSCGIWTESDVALVIFVPPLRKIYNKLFKMYPIARLTCSRNVIAQFQKPAVSAMWANQVTFMEIISKSVKIEEIKKNPRIQSTSKYLFCLKLNSKVKTKYI